MASPRERAIIVNGADVKAILAGTKTQLRKVSPVQPFESDGLWHAFYPWGEGGHGIYETATEMRAEFDAIMVRRCPLGVPGDRLWVRETWGSADRYYQDHENDVPRVVAYRADNAALRLNGERPEPIPAYDIGTWNWDAMTWRPSSNMPRWASRITLIVEDVRVQCLHDIAEDDARAEGVPVQLRAVPPGQDSRRLPCVNCGKRRDQHHGSVHACGGDHGGHCFNPATYRGGFAWQWNERHGKFAPWANNPWVWAVTFRKIEP